MNFYNGVLLIIPFKCAINILNIKNIVIATIINIGNKHIPTAEPPLIELILYFDFL